MFSVDFSDFPKGWFRIGFSKDLAINQVKTVHYFDQDLVMFRGDDNQVRVLDPYCAHLGAHLGHGGKVVNNTLQCPFHGWCWRGDGNVEHVPHAQRLPKRAKMKSWPVQEKYGIIFVYYHFEQQAPELPVADLPPFADDYWPNQSVFHKVINTTVYEISENAVDRAHFGYVHGGACCNGPDDHMAPMQLQEIEGGVRVTTDYHVQVGPFKQTASLEVNLLDSAVSYAIGRGGLEYAMVALPTPITRDRVENIYIFFTKRVPVPFNRLRHRIVQHFVSAEIDNDVPIWEHKTFHERPQLSDFDGPVMQWRKWMSQFYPPKQQATESSLPPLNDQVAGPLLEVKELLAS